MGKVTHFEIPANDPEKMVDFFAKAFGWKANRWGEMEYWLTDNGTAEVPGINGAFIRRGDKYHNTVVNTIQVDNIEETMKKISSNGGEVLTPKQTIPSVGWFVYFKDPEGTIHGAMQPDTNAK